MRTNANDFFGSNTGTAVYYKYNLSKMVYTDGVKALAEGCEAYWLLDLIMSYQIELNENLDTFQVWELRRSIETKFYIFATDGNSCKLASQQIEFSDFKYDRATLWVMNNCLLLPCEW